MHTMITLHEAQFLCWRLAQDNPHLTWEPGAIEVRAEGPWASFQQWYYNIGFRSQGDRMVPQVTYASMPNVAANPGLQAAYLRDIARRLDTAQILCAALDGYAVDYARIPTCSHCSGSGRVSQVTVDRGARGKLTRTPTEVPCDVCKGTGQRQHSPFAPLDRYIAFCAQYPPPAAPPASEAP